jgi:hypothetical protein
MTEREQLPETTIDAYQLGVSHGEKARTEKIIEIIKPCVSRDYTIQKILDAIEELD